MSALKHFVLSDFDKHNPVLNQLFEIFRATLKPDITYREFWVYYFKHKPHLLDISFIKEGEEIIGFICVSFYRHRINEESYTICRSAIGILEAYRGGRLPNWLLCWKYMKYKFCNPAETVYLNGFMANPLMYAMICKYTSKVYPKAGITVPAAIEKLRNEIVKFYGLHQKDDSPFVMKIHFQVHLNGRESDRIYKSDDKHVAYYLRLNPSFREQYGILTIVPVNWSNIFSSMLQAFFVKPLGKFTRNKLNAINKKWTMWKYEPAGKKASRLA